MPSKHSKNAGDRSHFSHHEKVTSKLGSMTHRLSTDSQLPFGYCPLNLQPITDPVVSPSGHMYSREAILEYILSRMQEIKQQQKEVDRQQKEQTAREVAAASTSQLLMIQSFEAGQLSVAGNVRERVASKGEEGTAESKRRRLLDETEDEERRAALQAVCPWVPQFTPSAPEAAVKTPARRPASPFSGQPLRAKDLIPVFLTREDSATVPSSGPVRFICPVSRKTITTQRVVLIKSTGTLLLESAAQETCMMDSMRDPLTGQAFHKEDILNIVPAASGFAASGAVEAKKYRPNFN